MNKPFALILAFAALASTAMGTPLPTPTPPTADELLRTGLFEEEANRDPAKAAAAYAGVVQQYDGQRKLAAAAVFRLAEIRTRQGNKPEAAALYKRLIAEFPDNEPLAKLSAERLGAPTLAGAPAVVGDGAPDAPTKEEADELAIVRDLVRSSPDLINAPAPNSNYPPLTLAAEKGWERVAALLIDNGAKVNADGSALRAAAAAGRKTMTEFLLAHGANVNAAAPDGWTALHAACAARRDEVIRLLLDKGANPNATSSATEATNTPDGNHQSPGTPLLLALQNQDDATVTLLLDRGADPNLWPDPLVKSSPLIAALRANDATAAKLLLARGAKADLVDASGLTALKAAGQHVPALVPTLLDLGLPQTPDRGALTPLYNSILAGGLPRAIGPNEKIGPVLSPAAFAARLVVYRAAWDALLAHGADINARDPQGQSVLHRVLHEPAYPHEIAAWLLDHGADVNAQDMRKQTPLHSYCNRFYAQPLSDEMRRGIAWLIERGADTNVEDVQGERPFVVGGRDKLGALDREFWFPQVIPRYLRERAITALVSEPNGTRYGSPHPVRLRPLAELDAPPSLVTVWRHAVGSARDNFEEVWTLTLYSGAAAGNKASARFTFDARQPAPDPATWPTLKWGDVVVLEAGERSGTTQEEEQRWANAFQASLKRTVSVQVGDRTGTLPFLDPMEFGPTSGNEPNTRLPLIISPGVNPRTGFPRLPPGFRPNADAPEPTPWWAPVSFAANPQPLSSVVLRLTESEPRAQLEAIRIERNLGSGQTETLAVNLRAADPAEATLGWDGQPSRVKRNLARLADGDRLIIPLRAANDPEALAARRATIGFAVPGRLLGVPVFARAQDANGGHTLGEALMQAYLGSLIVPNPDLSKIVIHRLKSGDSGEEEEIPADLARAIGSFDLQAAPEAARKLDVALQWGDVVEIAGATAGPWTGFDAATRAFLDKVLSRDLETTLNGRSLNNPGVQQWHTIMRPEFRLLDLNPSTQGQPPPSPAQYTFSALAFMEGLHSEPDTGARVDPNNVVRMSIRNGAQTREYNPAELKAINPWLDAGSKVEIQQFQP